MATASAVASDIGDIARGVRGAPFGQPVAKLASVRKAPMQRHEGGYYIRLQARDKPGTAATIARRPAPPVATSVPSMSKRRTVAVMDS